MNGLSRDAGVKSSTTPRKRRCHESGDSEEGRRRVKRRSGRLGLNSLGADEVGFQDFFVHEENAQDRRDCSRDDNVEIVDQTEEPEITADASE